MDVRTQSHSHASTRAASATGNARLGACRRARTAVRRVPEASSPDAHSLCVLRTSAKPPSKVDVLSEAPSVPSNKFSPLYFAIPTLLVVALLHPEPSLADESLSPELVDAFKGWLAGVEGLGAWAPLVFIATISVAECIPLFPTQPFTIGAGILFGATGGAACNLVGLCSAATLAFFLSRTIGQGLAEKVVEEETKSEPGPVQARIDKVKHAIENGSMLQQFGAISLLRLTPIVPFSASNYVLGLTPVSYPVFIAGTGLGMTVWSTVFASLGAAARNLLTSGMDFGAALAEVTEDAGEITEKVLVAALVVGILVLALSRLPSPIPAPEDLGKADRPPESLPPDNAKLKVPAGKEQ